MTEIRQIREQIARLQWMQLEEGFSESRERLLGILLKRYIQMVGEYV